MPFLLNTVIMSKRVYILILFSLLFATPAMAQVKKVYNEDINPMEQIDAALSQAREEGKYVLCQVGGNWCPWCLRFAEFADTNKAVRTTIDKNFVYIHINYSKGHTNPEAMKFLDNPARFGFPVFVILDQEGKRLHTQNSAYLEEGKGYSEKKVNEFLLNWTPEAVNTLK